MPFFYSYQAYFGHYKVKTLSSGLRCIVWWELSLIMASFLYKALQYLKEWFVFKALAIQWSKPVPRKWCGPVISHIINVLSRFLIPVPWLTRSLFHFQTRVPPFSTRVALYSGLASSFWIAGAEDGFYHLSLFMLFSSYCTLCLFFRCRHICTVELYLY